MTGERPGGGLETPKSCYDFLGLPGLFLCNLIINRELIGNNSIGYITDITKISVNKKKKEN